MSAASRIHAAMRQFRPPLPLAVAFSGGADSTALLLACHQRFPGQVAAIHVHHGLQQAAEGFVAFCTQCCARNAIPLQIERRDARHASGESPEDAARKARYEALLQGCQTLGRRLGRPLPAIALAQHADDQVETLLLALSRGAGLPGMAAMPSHWQRGGLEWYRPLLELPGTVLRQWLQQQGQGWVEDPSNADMCYTRNRIRHQVLPALEQALPGFRSTFARASGHAAQAQQLLDDIADDDLQALGLPPAIEGLRRLDAARQANTLRRWLKTQYGQTASTAQLRELQRQLTACVSRGHAIRIKVGQGMVVRDKAVLTWLK